MQHIFSKRLLVVAAASMALLLVACAGPNAELHNRNLKVSEGVASLMKSDPSVTLADSRIVCDHQRVTGSNFKVRICMLESEREELRESNLRSALGSGHNRSERIDSPEDGGAP